MNKFVEQFLKTFDLEKMGYQPFILIEYYPGNSLGRTSCYYMSLGKFFGPTNVTFQGDNVSFLSTFNPVMVKYRKQGSGAFAETFEVTIDSNRASFHMTDLNQCPLAQLGYVMTRANRACRLITGKEEIQEFINLLYNRTKYQKQWNYQWETLQKMYEAAVPKTHMYLHDFVLQRIRDLQTLGQS